MNAMANISVNLYDGSLHCYFDCSGAIKCKYALWEVMPVEDNEHCIYRYCGICQRSIAQIAAIERVKKRLSHIDDRGRTVLVSAGISGTQGNTPYYAAYRLENLYIKVYE